MLTNHFWPALGAVLLSACSSTSKILGSDDAGSDARGGSSGTAQAGSSGASGASGSSGNGGTGIAGSSGTAGSAGSTPDASVDGSGGGSAGTGDGGVESGCVPSDVTVDFSAQGTVRRARLDQRGVSVVGLADLQFSARDAGEPDAGLGVVGGYWDWSIDSSEFVTFTFVRPASNVKIFVTHALDVNNDSVYGKSAVTGYGAEGQSLGQLDIAGYGSKNISALFGEVPLSKFMVKDDVDGIAVGSLSFTACLAHQDFNDDKKDAGDIGAGHTVTALYELVSAGDKVPGAGVDDLKYQKLGPLTPEANSGELMTIKLRYKLPDGQTSRVLELPVHDEKRTLGSASPDFRFAAAVASFGMLLRDSPFKGSSSYADAIKLAESGVGDTRDSAARREFVGLVKKAESLAGR